MNPLVAQEFDNLRLVYAEVADGYTYSSKTKLYYKHLGEKDTATYVRKRKELYDESIAEGLPTKEKKTKQLIELGEWSDKKEDDILTLQNIITDNSVFLEGMFEPNQKKAMSDLIDSKKKELQELEREKRNLLGTVAEDFADERVSNYIFSIVSFKDSALKEKAFSFDDVDHMEYEEVYFHLEDYFKCLEKFSPRNLYKIGCLSFFLNPFSYMKERPESFWGQNFLDLSNYRLTLTNRGVRNLNILENSKTEPLDIDQANSIQEIVNWFDLQYSILSQSKVPETGVKKTKREVVKR